MDVKKVLFFFSELVNLSENEPRGSNVAGRLSIVV